ncbi:unnamed protein product [Arctia plantaginis]|uniref:Uncharacterized protein n=1 Tax=Arctia plantaginis TaxID=874455 RepID=A0A8S1B687_ARCPL|nr:unnamed protein product [Arctia plantaginis]
MLRITVKEKPIFKKKRDNYARKLKTKKLVNYLQSELRTTTTHGLAYIVNPEIHWFESQTGNGSETTLASYYIAISSVSLESLNVLDLPPPEILKQVKPENYAIIAADLFNNFDMNTLTTHLKWPITLDATMTEMGMCHLINSNVGILDDPTKWGDNTVQYVKKNIELSVHDIDYFVQVLNYADAYKVIVLHALLNYLTDDEKVCSLSELECLIEYKKEIMTLSTTNETRRKMDDIDNLPKCSRDCGCLGNCEADVYQNDYETFLPQKTMNRLKVMVSAFPKVRVMREIIFSFYDLFLRSGGVVNLCIGTSVISLMELIMTALRIPIYEIMQIAKGIWRRYTRPQIQKMSLIKKQS